MISIIVPVHNEQDNIKSFYWQLRETVSKLECSYEILFVNDASNDNSPLILQEIEKEDRDVRVIEFSRRQGQLYAYLAAFKKAGGDIIVTIDADKQYDPGDLPYFLKQIEAGFDFVSGWRINRADKLLRKIVTFIENKLINCKMPVKLHDWGCGFNVFRRKILLRINPYCMKNIVLLKPLLILFADSVTEVAVHHYPRYKGYSKYNFLHIVCTGFKLILTLWLRDKSLHYSRKNPKKLSSLYFSK